jgi:DNA polymerase III delta prime subunit
MRFPNSRDLNHEQEQVYLYAPTDGRMLVTGPPGTGKTVLAVLRALEVAKSNRTPVVAMFNKVLRSYTGGRNPERSGAHWDKIRFVTVLQFFAQLWDSLAVPPSKDDEWLLLNTPFAEKNDAKSAGAVWDPRGWYPGKRKPGCWKVDGEIYRREPAAFARWSPRPTKPTKEDGIGIDWERYNRALGRHARDLNWAAIDFEILIVDEAQDFPPAFFTLLRRLSEGFFGNTNCPSVMILADENQRITEENSTIADIIHEMEIPEDRHYRLTTNFRNTRQVAEAAAHFYAGMQTGLPLRPSRTGPVPELRRCSDRSALRARLLRYAENNPRHQVGLICLGADKTREQYFQDLKQHSGKDRLVQTYSSVNADHGDVSALEFEKPCITVLNRASCKGLEFDAVYIVSLEDTNASEAQADFFRMNMYVMCSRARESLFLVWNGGTGASPSVLRLMPTEPVVRIKG